MLSADTFKIYIPSALLVLLAFVLAYQFVEPAPPSKMTIATGSKDGAYSAVGSAYRRVLARYGIELELIHTNGSIENIELLQADEADLAFVQGGIFEPLPDVENPQSLGTVFIEPLWVFSSDFELSRLSALGGKRIAIGPKGSGTRQLALMLLKDNGITADNSIFFEISSVEAAKELAAGRIDAGMFVMSERSPLLMELLAEQKLHLMSFERSSAYAQRYPFMHEVVLHEGAVNLAENKPPRSTRLVAASASLAINPQLHPALIDLMMQIVQANHRSGGLLEGRDRYPAPEGNGFELNDQARKFYDRGPPFLQRYLPFWAANLVDRMAVMLIPLLTLMLPLARILPPALDWRVRSRVYRWYDDLREVELNAEKKLTPERLQVLQQQLDELEDQVSAISVPLTRTDLVYTLREHISLIRERLQARNQQVSAAPERTY